MEGSGNWNWEQPVWGDKGETDEGWKAYGGSGGYGEPSPYERQAYSGGSYQDVNEVEKEKEKEERGGERDDHRPSQGGGGDRYGGGRGEDRHGGWRSDDRFGGGRGEDRYGGGRGEDRYGGGRGEDRYGGGRGEDRYGGGRGEDRYGGGRGEDRYGGGRGEDRHVDRYGGGGDRYGGGGGGGGDRYSSSSAFGKQFHHHDGHDGGGYRGISGRRGSGGGGGNAGGPTLIGGRRPGHSDQAGAGLKPAEEPKKQFEEEFPPMPIAKKEAPAFDWSSLSFGDEEEEAAAAPSSTMEKVGTKAKGVHASGESGGGSASASSKLVENMATKANMLKASFEEVSTGPSLAEKVKRANDPLNHSKEDVTEWRRHGTHAASGAERSIAQKLVPKSLTHAKNIKVMAKSTKVKAGPTMVPVVPKAGPKAEQNKSVQPVPIATTSSVSGNRRAFFESLKKKEKAADVKEEEEKAAVEKVKSEKNSPAKPLSHDVDHSKDGEKEEEDSTLQELEFMKKLGWNPSEVEDEPPLTEEEMRAWVRVKTTEKQ